MANLFDVDSSPDREPSSFTAGSFVQWRRPDLSSDYDTSLYSLVYVARITGGGASEFTVTANEVGGQYVVQIPSATSATFVVGDYHWQAEIHRTSDGEIVVVGTGDFTVLPDLDANQSDPRTHAEIMLSKIESLLEGKADKDVSSYSIAGRSITKLSITELMDWRNFYKREVAKVKRDNAIRNGRPSNSTIKVRFP